MARKRKDKTIPLPTIIVDTREQEPFEFRATDRCAGSESSKLDCGDYAIKDHTELIVIERKKGVDELCGNFGANRERFERELERMKTIRFKYVVVEDYWSSIFKPSYSRMPPNVIFESIFALELKYGIHFIFAGSRTMAHNITRSLLLRAYKYKMEGILK